MSAHRLLAQAIDIHAWLEQDQGTPLRERVQRDRAVGLDQIHLNDVKRVLNWWSQVDTTVESAWSGEHVVSVRRWMSVGLFILGLLAGAVLCRVALTYDGNYPVNLLALVGVLVGIPGLMLLFTLLAVCLRSAGFSPLDNLLANLNVNRWIIGVWDRFAAVRFASSFGQNNARGKLAYWQLVAFSQWFGCGFFIGVSATFVLLVAVTDLAFGWSTTLQLEAQTVASWVIFLSSPWASWWPLAAPQFELVELSRFYRLEGLAPGSAAAQFGRWWPFVLMTITVWGLVPRVLMSIFSVWRLNRATQAFLLEHSEVTSLLDRLATPSVSYAGEVDVDDVQNNAEPLIPSSMLLDADSVVIVWNNAVDLAAFELLIAQLISMSTLQTEQQQLSSLQSISAGVRKLVVLTKGWEPPVLEFNDLVALIRATVGDQVSIVVAPMGLGETLTASDLSIWTRAMAKLGDPRLYVADGSQEINAEGSK